MAPRDGFEPPARRLTVVCSTAELPGNIPNTYNYVFNLIIIKCNNLINKFKELNTNYFFKIILAIFGISELLKDLAFISFIILRSFLIVLEVYEGS